ncbi:MAG TPA: SDR family oxidoreductase [Phycisphaerae bacterium]|jgi:UDP-glucuronate decarboxylase|nr:SDR family oxidoreductase [Phycisphaerae bacterium]HOB76364.1 SDR family oxidoreductase [Phycisphaerae bacterium]HOJ55388.1 SDR family oxidoreductase [Phycisphaerae bacterium]HOL24936.1 SDR family oxidoreductase [Phycisphaerae bacterium]HPP20038.1 SDR family oxidoreductase [Phycisphaerae bacterium]
MTRQTILVTGGAGFIGSHLCLRLFDEGHHVICLDNYFTGRIENFGDRYQELLLSGRFEWIRHDVIQPIILEVDQIYHLACPASPVHYQYNPVKTIKTNVIGTYNMLGLAKRVRARILQASTSEVYGDPTIHPQPETYWGNVNPIGIRSCYDEGKRVAETLMMDYHRQHKLPIRIARIFNTYGPNMSVNDGRVMSNFICQALRGEPITVYGDGTQTRSFCYVSDLVDGLIRLMNSDFHEPVNLGNDEELTMLRLVQAIEAATRRPLKVEHKPLPQDDPTRRRPDLTRARKILGYEPKVSLEEGLKKTIGYFEHALGLK